MVDDTSLLLLEQKYRNNNPGNIKLSSDWTGDFYFGKQYYGAVGKPLPKIKYKKFDTKEEGLANIITTIKKYDTNSLNEIITRYAGDDESGERYKSYYEDLSEIYEVPDNIDFTNKEHVIRLMKGITDIENDPDANDYYNQDDYIQAYELLIAE